MMSILQLAEIPREFGILLLGLTLALALVPYFAGHDFGVVKIPNLQWQRRRVLRVLGPLLLALAAFLHAPVFSRAKPPTNSVAVLPVTFSTNDPQLAKVAETITAEIFRRLSEDAKFKVASPNSVRLLREKEHAARIGAELKVAAIVEGFVDVSEGNLLVASPIVVYSSEGYVRWTRRYCSRKSGQKFDVSDLAARVADDIKLVLAQGERGTILKGLAGKHDTSCEQQSSQNVSLALQFKERTPYPEHPDKFGDAVAPLAGALSSPVLADRRLLIKGHVHSTGDAANDLRLSEARATVVKAMLIAQGVSSARLVAVGKGASEPFDHDNSFTNNRIEISLIE